MISQTHQWDIVHDRPNRRWWADCSCGWFHAAKTQDQAHEYVDCHLGGNEDG